MHVTVREIEFCDDLAGGELRQPIHSLQPTLLAAGGFPAAMAYLIEEIQTATSPGKEFCQRAIDADQILSEWKQAVVGITQESLVNACRHSKSKRLFLELTLDGDTLCIHARDWGVGFKPKGTATGRFGLGGTCRRLKLLGGTATIDSEPGKGTYVNAEIPLFPRGRSTWPSQVEPADAVWRRIGSPGVVN